MDKFPEAFERFEKRVDVSRMKSFEQLTLAFSHWAGKQWLGSNEQVNALKVEALKRGMPVPREVYHPYSIPEPRTWKYETVAVRGKLQYRYRDITTGRFIKKPF
jgi:hypothetical protein